MVVWSPLKFNSGREVANRFVIAPLTTDSSHEDGTAAEDELEFVRRRAANGFGAVISSATYVADDGRSWQGTGAAHDGHLSSLSRLAEAMRAAGRRTYAALPAEVLRYAGDFLPSYSGNLDIMTAAATKVGEVIARHLLEGASE